MSIAVRGVRAGALVLIVPVAAAILWLALRHRSLAPSIAELPPWFGDANRPPTRIAGKVFGPTGHVQVRMWIDAPDPFIWPGNEVATSDAGEFDFGPMRAGRYNLLASGDGWLSRVVLVDTLRGAGDHTELFAYEWKTIDPKLRKSKEGDVLDFDWSRARWLSTTHEHQLLPSRLPAITGTVLKSDGTPAAFVGVVPIAQPHVTHEWPHDMGLVATTDAAGRFSFVPNDSLRGLRILMGPRMHEVDIAHDVYLQPEMAPLSISLPAVGAEHHSVFETQRRDVGDPQGAWIRGRVVRGGHAVPDAAVSVFVPPQDNMEIFDETRTRSDGSFEIYVSSRDLDKCRAVVVNAGEGLEHLHGRAAFALVPGETLEGVTIEIGAGVHVAGIVVDEAGHPVQGVRVGSETWWELWSVPTDSNGHFELTLGPQGRYRLRVFNEARAELQPPEGRLPPSVDVSLPDGTRADVRVVVRTGSALSREHFISGWTHDGYVDMGAEIKRNTVTAVGDELEAAGLRVGDVLVGTDPATPTYGTSWLDHANMVPQGQSTTFTIERDHKQMRVHVDALYFGASSGPNRKIRRGEGCE